MSPALFAAMSSLQSIISQVLGIQSFINMPPINPKIGSTINLKRPTRFTSSTAPEPATVRDVAAIALVLLEQKLRGFGGCALREDPGMAQKVNDVTTVLVDDLSRPVVLSHSWSAYLEGPTALGQSIGGQMLIEACVEGIAEKIRNSWGIGASLFMAPLPSIGDDPRNCHVALSSIFGTAIRALNLNGRIRLDVLFGFYDQPEWHETPAQVKINVIKRKITLVHAQIEDFKLKHNLTITP